MMIRSLNTTILVLILSLGMFIPLQARFFHTYHGNSPSDAFQTADGDYVMVGTPSTFQGKGVLVIKTSTHLYLCKETFSGKRQRTFLLLINREG